MSLSQYSIQIIFIITYSLISIKYRILFVSDNDDEEQKYYV